MLSIVGGLSNEPRTRFALIALDRRRRNATVALHSAACRLFAGNARRGTKLVETNPECSPSWRNSCLFSSRTRGNPVASLRLWNANACCNDRRFTTDELDGCSRSSNSACFHHHLCNVENRWYDSWKLFPVPARRWKQLSLLILTIGREVCNRGMWLVVTCNQAECN